MDIHHLKVFLSVFRNRGFSKASEELRLSQPTVSSHIKAIEEELDCMLFDRAGRSVIPTKEAELLYIYVSEMVEKFEGIKTAICRLKEEISGELTIGASTIPGTYIIPALASEFKRKHPNISFQVVIEDSRKITDMVSNHELLLGIVGAKMEHGKIEYQPFIEDELIFVSSPDLLNRNKISLKDITDIPFLLREEGSGTRKMMEKHLSEEGISLRDLNVAAVLGSTDSVKEAVKAGLGASILSKIAVKGEIKTGILEEIKIKSLNMKRSFYIITHKRRTLPKHYRAFFDYLKKLSR
ncbi:MAG: selenium metabolism-associated LysR family transcriptional regulator [Nitrospirota bacterium]